MAAERRSATVVAARMAGQTADTRRSSTAVVPTDDRVAVPIRHDLTAPHLMDGRAVVGDIEAALPPTVDLAAAVGDIAEVAVPPLADPAAVAVEDIAEEVVVVRAEVAVAVRAEAVVLRMRPRHTVAAEGLIAKVVRACPQPSP